MKLHFLIIYFFNRRNYNESTCHLFVCTSRDGSWRSVAEAFRSSNDCSNINDSVNHSAHRTSKEPSFFSRMHSTNWGTPEIHLCKCWYPLWKKHVSPLFSLLPYTITHHSVTWCNVRAMGRLAVGGGWVSLWLSAVCMCTTEPWLPHYLIIKRLFFSSSFYRTVEIFPKLCVTHFFLKDRSALIFI